MAFIESRAPVDFSTTPTYLFARDVQERLTPNATQRTTLIVAGVYIIVIAILWCVVGVTVHDCVLNIVPNIGMYHTSIRFVSTLLYGREEES